MVVGIALVGVAAHEAETGVGVPLIPHTLGAAGIAFGSGAFIAGTGWGVLKDGWNEPEDRPCE